MNRTEKTATMPGQRPEKRDHKTESRKRTKKESQRFQAQATQRGRLQKTEWSSEEQKQTTERHERTRKHDRNERKHMTEENERVRKRKHKGYYEEGTPVERYLVSLHVEMRRNEIKKK